MILACAIEPVAAGATDIGQRRHNEDHVLVRPELGLFVLADGAGGHNAGNVASALAATTIANTFESSALASANLPDFDQAGCWRIARRLAAAIRQAHVEIVEVAKKAAKYHGMGTTVAAIAFAADGTMAHIAHVGDSRCYRLRSSALEALTVDHSLLVDVLETCPEADDDLLARVPKHVVTRALGMEDELRVTTRSLRVLPGDTYMLCSDGLTDVLGEWQIEGLLAQPRSAEEHVRTLVAAALAAGADDNVAAIVIVCRETAGRPSLRPSSAPPDPPLSHRHAVNSAPEIVIVGVETHVVPATAASATLLDALGQLQRLRQPSLVEAVQPKPERCVECGQPLDAGARLCPTCGTGQP